MNDPVLATKGLERSFTQGDVTIDVLRGVDLSIARGEAPRTSWGRMTFSSALNSGSRWWNW